MASPLPPVNDVSVPSAEQLAAMGMTAGQWVDLQNSIANMDLSNMMLNPLNLIGGTYSGPTLNEADYLYTAPVSNKGNPTSLIDTGGNTFAVMPGQEVRLVDTTSGKVVYQGTGKEAANEIIQLAANLSEDKGNKAGWEIQTGAGGIASEWGGTTGEGAPWTTVAKEKVNKSALGTIADVALPVAASLLVPGGGLFGTILPAAGGSVVSSVAQGRSLEDTLLRAALAGGGSGLGEFIFTPGVDALGNSISEMANTAIANLPTSVAGTTAGSIAGSTAAGAGGGLFGDIIVTGARNVAPSFINSVASGVIPSLVPSFFDGAQFTDMAPTQPTTEPPAAPGDIVVTAQTPTPNFPAVTPPLIPTPTPTPPTFPEEIVVTGQPQTPPQVPTPVIIPPSTPTPPTPTFPDEIVVTAPSNTTPVITPPIIPPALQPNAPVINPDTTPPPPDNKNIFDKLTSNLNLLDYLALAGLVGSAVSGGGGTGSTPTTPYVSPFGAMGGIGTGLDYRANPNITDYERYGFGPEATFFQPAYNALVSNATATTPNATPSYTPLI